MNSKEVAQLFELPIDTIRYYERVGVIPPITRDKNGYRIFEKRDLNWIFLAKSLRKAGLSIESLIEFANLAQSKENNVRAAQKQILKDQLIEVNAKLEEMIRARDLLEYKIETFDDHVAKINAGEMNDDEVEELWTMKHFKVKQ
jgi:DNA-binding transcriptional MerR regulator